jgi:hypothetical protein
MLALVGPHLLSLRGLMNPPGSVSRVSVREPSNYEKVDRLIRVPSKFGLKRRVVWGTAAVEAGHGHFGFCRVIIA